MPSYEPHYLLGLSQVLRIGQQFDDGRVAKFLTLFGANRLDVRSSSMKLNSKNNDDADHVLVVFISKIQPFLDY